MKRFSGAFETRQSGGASGCFQAIGKNTIPRPVHFESKKKDG
jgi:hypothetical protein